MKHRRQAAAPAAKACEPPPPLDGVVLSPFPKGLITRCPKCRADGALTISYYGAEARCAHPFGSADGFGLPAFKRVWGQDRLHRTCGTCGYTWDHACADAAADDAR